MELTKLELSEIWIKIKNEYSSLSRKALLFLIPYTTTYLCAIDFSSMLVLKNKFRNKLNLDPNLRLILKTEPDIYHRLYQTYKFMVLLVKKFVI